MEWGNLSWVFQEEFEWCNHWVEWFCLSTVFTVGSGNFPSWSTLVGILCLTIAVPVMVPWPHLDTIREQTQHFHMFVFYQTRTHIIACILFVFCVGFCWSGEVRGHDVTVVICYIYRGLCTYTYSILLCLYVHITILSYIFTIIYIFTHVFVGPKTIAQLVDLQTSGGCRCGGGHGAAAQLAVGTQRDPGVSRCSAGGGRKKKQSNGFEPLEPQVIDGFLDAFLFGIIDCC